MPEKQAIPGLNELRSRLVDPDEPRLHARLFARKFSIPVTWLFLHTSLTADAVSLISILLVIAGCAVFVPGGLAWNLAAIVLLQFSDILDCCDGEIARYRGTSSPTGFFVDSIRHQVAMPGIFVALSFNVWWRHGSLLLMAAGFMGAVFGSRFVRGLVDQAVLRALEEGTPGEDTPRQAAARDRFLGKLERTLAPLFVDFNFVDVLTACVIVDGVIGHVCGGSVLPGGFTFLDTVFAVWCIALPVVKTASFIRWSRRGVESEAARIEQKVLSRRDGTETRNGGT